MSCAAATALVMGLHVRVAVGALLRVVALRTVVLAEPAGFSVVRVLGGIMLGNAVVVVSFAGLCSSVAVGFSRCAWQQARQASRNP